jgi:hypothetical protein
MAGIGGFAGQAGAYSGALERECAICSETFLRGYFDQSIICLRCQKAAFQAVGKMKEEKIEVKQVPA